MKTIFGSFVVAMACLLLTPPESRADKYEIHTRGWIGGRYMEAGESFWAKISLSPPASTDAIYVLPEKIKTEYAGGIFVARVFDNTPAANGGMTEGELVLRVNERKTPDLDTFFEIIDATEPGSKLTVLGFHNGKIITHTLIAGRESYKKVGHFDLFLGFGSELDIIPNPDFSLFSMISFKRNKQRLELNSPSFKYYRENLDTGSENTEYALHRSEGWGFRLIPFGIGRDVVIVAQDVF